MNAEPPPATGASLAPEPGPVRPARWWAAAAFSWVGGGLAGASILTAWWTIYLPTTGMITFRPGGTLLLFSVRPTESIVVPYASVGAGPIEALYEAILALGIGLLGLGLLLGFLAALVPLGRLRGPASREIVRKLLVAAVVTSAFALAVAPALQPILAQRSSQMSLGLCSATNDTSVSPCHSFWGSGAGGDGLLVWGADVGWFLMLVALVFNLAALIAALPKRTKPLPPPAALAPAPGPVGPTP